MSDKSLMGRGCASTFNGRSTRSHGTNCNRDAAIHDGFGVVIVREDDIVLLALWLLESYVQPSDRESVMVKVSKALGGAGGDAMATCYCEGLEHAAKIVEEADDLIEDDAARLTLATRIRESNDDTNTSEGAGEANS